MGQVGGDGDRWEGIGTGGRGGNVRGGGNIRGSEERCIQVPCLDTSQSESISGWSYNIGSKFNF